MAFCTSRQINPNSLIKSNESCSLTGIGPVELYCSTYQEFLAFRIYLCVLLQKVLHVQDCAGGIVGHHKLLATPFHTQLLLLMPLCTFVWLVRRIKHAMHIPRDIQRERERCITLPPSFGVLMDHPCMLLAKIQPKSG